MNDIETLVRKAYADVTFSRPEGALRPVLRHRRQRMALAMTAAAVAIAAGVGAAMAGANLAPAPPPAGNEDQTEAELCAQLATERLREHPHLQDRDRVLPSTNITFPEPGDGSDQDDRSGEGEWLRLYLGARVIVSCFGSGTDTWVELDYLPVAEPDTVWLDGDVLATFGRSIDGGQSFVVIGVPPATERVEVVLPDGKVVPAYPAGDRYVAWLARHPGEGLAAVEEQTVVAYTADRIYTLKGGDRTSRER